MKKDWKQHLNIKEADICLSLACKVKMNNQIDLTEDQMYKYCHYKSFRYFKNHLEGLIEKNIIIFDGNYCDKPYFFNPIYIEYYNELGPKIYNRPLEMYQN
ncbi:hypothetical protein [Bacillus toyonensis]|uniref:hypothetical protein n=1 Tax=Bacillus toyonensis TaxID=155322 RepID=UPI002E1F0270|nr:hypothetical protein [Bacillus toyonensis]